MAAEYSLAKQLVSHFLLHVLAASVRRRRDGHPGLVLGQHGDVNLAGILPLEIRPEGLKAGFPYRLDGRGIPGSRHRRVPGKSLLGEEEHVRVREEDHFPVSPSGISVPRYV